jgi:glutamate formiminotransferase / 5-formyltetrahydrofolate cyclo-ligase
VANVSEGRDTGIIEAIAAACGPVLLDVHCDPDHHRSVFTIAGPGPADASPAARRLAAVVAEQVDLTLHTGVHPRLGALDVVPFVAIDPADGGGAVAVEAAHSFAAWFSSTFDVPVFFYGDAAPGRRSLADVRLNAFAALVPDLGPAEPHPRLGATAVGVRPPMIAINCNLTTDDVSLARRIASAVRERDGGLPGVRALGFALASRGQAQVSMNLVALERTGLEHACTEVRRLAEAAGAGVADVELVGLLPKAELDGCSDEFRSWSGITSDRTVESRLAAVAPAARPGRAAAGPA